MRRPASCRWVVATAVALLAAGLAGGARGSGAAEGDPAPDLRLTDIEGRPFSLAGHSGRVVSLHLFAIWCEPCLADLPAIEQAAARYRGRGYTAVLLGVPHRQDENRLREFARQRGLALVVLYDAKGDAGRTLGATGLPYTVVVGRDGTIRKAGASLPDSFLEKIGRLVAEKAP